MSKLYINGVLGIKVTMKKPGKPDRVFNFTNKYYKLTEQYKRITTIHEWDDGSKTKTSHYVNYKWTIIYPDEIVAPDLLNYGEIENLEISGWTVWLTVHLDNGDRVFKALIIDNERTIDTEAHFGAKDSTTNKGYEMSFTNADPILNIDMVNMDLYVAGGGGTNTAPDKGQVQT